jgi:hypothetical protein
MEPEKLPDPCGVQGYFEGYQGGPGKRIWPLLAEVDLRESEMPPRSSCYDCFIAFRGSAGFERMAFKTDNFPIRPFDPGVRILANFVPENDS